MKRVTIILIAVLFAAPVFPQEMFEQLTDNYADQEGFSATKITNDMFDLYLRKKNVEKDSPVYETLKKLDNILVASQSSFGEEEEVDISEIHSEILDYYNQEEYTLFKTEKQMGEDVKVYLKKENEKISSLALVTASGSSVNLVEMNGDIDLARLSELSKALNLRGLENLYKVHGGNSYPFFGNDVFLPQWNSEGWTLGDIYIKDWDSEDFFNGEKIKDLQRKIQEQNFLTQEQREKIEQQAQEMVARQTEMAKKYQEMAERYGRQPIFLSYPGDSTTVYYIDGKKVTPEEVKDIDKDNIESIEIDKSGKGDKSVVRIKTK